MTEENEWIHSAPKRQVSCRRNENIIISRKYFIPNVICVYNLHVKYTLQLNRWARYFSYYYFLQVLHFGWWSSRRGGNHHIIRHHKQWIRRVWLICEFKYWQYKCSVLTISVSETLLLRLLQSPQDSNSDHCHHVLTSVWIQADFLEF